MFYYGDFYRLDGSGCRATLEIVDRHVPTAQLDRLPASRPEVVVVMMNPGGSHPIEPVEAAERTPDAIGVQVGLVPTCPDETQLAIAEVMRCRGFHHCRVLNLSDIREPDSEAFLKGLKDGKHPTGDSVFCSQRADELVQRLNPSTNVVVCAWGKDYRLQSRAKDALEQIAAAPALRLLGWGKAPFFMHPSRRPKQWPRWILNHWPA